MKSTNVFVLDYKKETAMQRERSRSRSRSRDREIFSESVWDRSEVEGPSSSTSDRENKEREKREKKYEMSQIQREKESTKVYQPPHPKDRPKPMSNYNHNKQSVATFKTHMVQRSVQEKERKTSATTISSINNGQLDEAGMIGHDPPAPVMPTQLNNPASACLTYNKVQWKLHVRKEVFRPNESVNAPAALDLIFSQIISDVLGITPCLRITPQERRTAIDLLNSHGITRDSLSISVRVIVKRHLLDMARGWPLYFSRMFSLNTSPVIPSGTSLAVSHSAVYLTRKEQDFIAVQKIIPLIEIKDATMLPRFSTFQLTLSNGNRIVLNAPKAAAIQSMIQSFVAECLQVSEKLFYFIFFICVKTNGDF